MSNDKISPKNLAEYQQQLSKQPEAQLIGIKLSLPKRLSPLLIKVVAQANAGYFGWESGRIKCYPA